jgi:hypothetical protein
MKLRILAEICAGNVRSEVCVDVMQQRERPLDQWSFEGKLDSRSMERESLKIFGTN